MKYFSVEKINPQDLPFHERVQDIKEADVMIVYGGDGSIIEAVNFLTRHDCFDVKILGVNTGHVGFLSNDINTADVFHILQGKTAEWPHYHVSRRKLLSVSSKLQERYGINEVVIGPKTLGRLFTTDINIDGIPITYQGDGLVISSSSGSTAYNLSAGGPIMTPAVDGICITPLNPFSLASRPLVVHSNSVITVAGNPTLNIIIDGNPTNQYDITITLSDKTIDILKVNSFMDDIQNKLGWNRNIKN